VYWFRGGFPEWDEHGLAVESLPTTMAETASRAAQPVLPAAVTKAR
jgi:3-mercaptopyruvate sulfurtransferase SseA